MKQGLLHHQNGVTSHTHHTTNDNTQRIVPLHTIVHIHKLCPSQRSGQSTWCWTASSSMSCCKSEGWFPAVHPPQPDSERMSNTSINVVPVFKEWTLGQEMTSLKNYIHCINLKTDLDNISQAPTPLTCIAFLAISWQRTNHCFFRRGSMTSPERLRQCGRREEWQKEERPYVKTLQNAH